MDDLTVKGDFAIFVSAGFSPWRALFLNAFANATSFLGVVASLLLAQPESSRSWILALTAGNFLYIALVDLVPELQQSTTSTGAASTAKSRTLRWLVQNVGILCGVGSMVAIALWGETLEGGE